MADRRRRLQQLRRGAQRAVRIQRPPAGTPVDRIERLADGVAIDSHRGREDFDDVVIATHSDQALRMLADPSDAEREILGAIPFRANETVLHTDTSLMPRREAAWASWNFHLTPEGERTTLTYDMNRLQRLDAPVPFLVTLNRTEAIDPTKVHRVINYSHPVFTNEGMRAQERWREISGANRTHFCGAYWRWGFHEDGCWSGLRVSEALGGRGPGLGGVVPAAIGSSPAEGLLPDFGEAGCRRPVPASCCRSRPDGRPPVNASPRAHGRGARRAARGAAGARRTAPPHAGRAMPPPSTRASSSTPAASPSGTSSATGSSCLCSISPSCPSCSTRSRCGRRGARAPARLRRSDHLGETGVPLDRAARELVFAELGWVPAGPVRLLANPRYWGIGMNPVAFYYLHGELPGGDAGPVEAMIAEVTNTPWGESRCYVLDARAGREPSGSMAATSTSACTSPRSCRWSRATAGRRTSPVSGSGPAQQSRRSPDGEQRKVFEAGVDLGRREITPRAMASLLLRYPPMTASTFARIYVNALKLKLKGVPYFRNPSKE